VKIPELMKPFSLSMLIILLLVNSFVLSAQTDIKIRRKEFMNDKAGFKEAWLHVSAGDDYFAERAVWYGSAYDEYRRAIAYNNMNPELNYKAGAAALFSDNKEAAAEYLLKALEQKSDLTDDILLLTGRALQYSGRYSEAIVKLNDYLNSGVRKTKQTLSDATKYLEECNAALDVLKDTLRAEIKNIGSNINSSSDDYAGIFSVDYSTLYFASRREVPKSSISLEDAKFDENIFFSTWVNNGWVTAALAGNDLNTVYCETPLYLNQTGDELFIYAGYENGGDIKVSVNKKGSWKAPEPVQYKINTGGSETSFTISPSGNEIWYVSDNGKDGMGGKDIYLIKKTGERKWSKPQNAGPNINSVFDEESVRFSEKGDTLWFGSKGHNSIGGFDIFYSVKDPTGAWAQAVNRGYPVNTSWDELFFIPAKSAYSTFYLASNRSGSMGGLDILEGRMLPPEPVMEPVIAEVIPPKPDTVIIRDTVVVIREIVKTPPPAEPPIALPEPPKEVVLFLIGKVKDSETGDPVMSKVDVIDLSTDQIIATTASSDIDGTYRVRLPSKKSYMIDFRGPGFLSDMRQVNIPETYSEEFYNLDISLIKVKVGKKVVLNNILFQTGKSILTTSSYAELDRLVGILNENALMRIEISGHTDNTGSLTLNSKLSEDRAKAVVEYIVQKGIDRARLEFKGYGPLQPIADNATTQGRTQNRRVEFKILEF
jgi:outer membrane protein OmpA-like peptidoglycan-associated protein